MDRYHAIFKCHLKHEIYTILEKFTSLSKMHGSEVELTLTWIVKMLFIYRSYCVWRSALTFQFSWCCTRTLCRFVSQSKANYKLECHIYSHSMLTFDFRRHGKFFIIFLIRLFHFDIIIFFIRLLPKMHDFPTSSFY